MFSQPKMMKLKLESGIKSNSAGPQNLLRN